MQEFLRDFRRRLKLSLRINLKLGEPRQVARQRKVVEEKFDGQLQPPDVTDLNKLLAKVRSLWNENGPEGLTSLSIRERKWLPWILYFGESPKIIEGKEPLHTILALVKKQKNSLSRLIHVYLKFYKPEFYGTEVLRKTILDQLSAYEGNNPRIRHWKGKAVLLFQPTGPAITAQWILSENDEIPTCLKKLGLGGDLSNGSFLKYVVREILKTMEKVFPNHLDNLRPLLEVRIGSGTSSRSLQARFPELIPEAATRLLPRARETAPSWVRDILRPFFLHHLGDPRLPGGKVKWHGVSKRAVRVFKQWLSQKDLEFFFNLVEMSSGDPKWIYRRRFWEAYVNYFENTWVALGNKAISLVSTSDMKAHLEKRKFGKLVGSSDQSVFLIEMGGYVFVEWSHSGACRIWQKDHFPWELGELKYRAKEFTGTVPDHKQNHWFPEWYRWQEELDEWIQRNLGIRPAKSYYLE